MSQNARLSRSQVASLNSRASAAVLLGALALADCATDGTP